MEEINILTGERLTADDVRQFSATNSAQRKTDDVLLSEQVFRRNLSALSQWRLQVESDRNFAAGAQWTDDRKKIIELRGQTPLSIDCISPAIEQAVALLTSNHPGYSVTGAEDSDRKRARYFADLVNYIQVLNNFRMLIKQVIRDYYVGGVGWLGMGWDPMMSNGRGDIGQKYLDALSVFPDVMAKDFFWQDAPHIIVAKVRTFEQFSFLMPELIPYLYYAEQVSGNPLGAGSKEVSTIFSAASEKAIDNFSNKYLELDRYSKIRVPKINIFKPDIGFEKLVDPEAFEQQMQDLAFIRKSQNGIQFFVDPASVRDAREALNSLSKIFHAVQDQNGQLSYQPGSEQDHNDPNTIPVPNSTTELEPTTWGNLLDEGILKAQSVFKSRVLRTYSIGGILVYKNMINIEDYPLIPLVNNFDSSVQPVSDIRRVKGIQTFINELHTDIVAHAEQSSNIRVAFPEGNYNEDDLNARWNNPVQTFIPFNPDMGMGLQMLYPPPLPNELYKSLADAKMEIERILGIYALMQGSPNDAPTTYKGTVALDEYGQRRIRSKKDDVEDFVTQVARVTVQFMQAYYTDERAFRITRPNKQEFTLTINPSRFGEDTSEGMEYVINDITVGQYDIRVTPGSMLPSNRWALAEYYKELLQIGAIDLEEFHKKTEVADAEELMQRMDDRKQMRQVIEQLQAQLKQVSGDLQTAQRESMHDRKRMKVLEYDTELHKLKTQAQAGTELYLKGLQDELRISRQAKKEKNRNGRS
jgi:hypothetical protein